MHPIERLRFVARSGAGDAVALVEDACRALAAFADDPAGLVAAARRLVARHPGVGPMWWACSRIAVAPDPVAEAEAVLDALAADPTADRLVAELPDECRALIVGWPSAVVLGLARRGDVGVLAVDDGTGTDVGRLLSRVEIEVDDLPAEAVGAGAEAADVVLVEATALGPDAALAAPGCLAAVAVARSRGGEAWLVAPTGASLPSATFAACLSATRGPRPSWAAGADLLDRSLFTRTLDAGPVAPVAPELLRSARTPGSFEP